MKKSSGDWSSIKYFVSSEFDSSDEVGSGINMNIEFVKKLDKLRECYGSVMKVSSGYRTKAHNQEVGGVNGSYHTRGEAADIFVSNFNEMQKLSQCADNVGIKGLFQYKTKKGNYFVHLDNRTSKSTGSYVFDFSQGKLVYSKNRLV